MKIIINKIIESAAWFVRKSEGSWFKLWLPTTLIYCILWWITVLMLADYVVIKYIVFIPLTLGYWAFYLLSAYMFRKYYGR